MILRKKSNCQVYVCLCFIEKGEKFGPCLCSHMRFQLSNMVAGNITKAARNALELEERRLLTYKELSVKNEAIRLSTNKVNH